MDARSAAVSVRPPRSGPGISPPVPSDRFLQCQAYEGSSLGKSPFAGGLPPFLPAAAGFFAVALGEIVVVAEVLAG
jgi:hypothetical protein